MDFYKNGYQSSIQRDSALEQLLLGDLLDLLDDPDDPEVQMWLLTILDALLRILPREFCSEEAGGYMREVLEEYPSWDRQVRILHSQHQQIFTRLRELRNDVARMRPRQGVSPRCRLSLYEWVELLNDHNGQEVALLQTAINLEVGVGD